MEINSHTSTVALKTFFNIMQKWQIPEDQQQILLGVDENTFFLYKIEAEYSDGLSGVLEEETLMRISYIIGIYKNLHILLPDNESADSWIKKHNKGLAPEGNLSALDLMLKGLYFIDVIAHYIRQFVYDSNGNGMSISISARKE